MAITENPMVMVSPDKLSVLKCKAETLSCSVSGIPQPISSWTRVSKVEELINLPSESYIGGNTDCLTITDFDKQDEGIYACKATDEAGERISNKSFLTYIGKFKLFKDNI